MNWTCLVYGAPMLLVTIWWFVDARKWFKGPRVNIEHQMLGREPSVSEHPILEPANSGSSQEGSSTSNGRQDVDQKVAKMV